MIPTSCKYLLGAVLLVALPCVAHGQFRNPNPSGPPPAPLGMPNSSNPANATPSIEADPRVMHELLRQRRIQAYRKMHQDARTLQQVVQHLNARFNPPSGDAAPRQDEQQALKESQQIEKLAAEIDRLMRED